MVSAKQWFLMNLSLVALAAILVLNFFGLTIPSAGQVASLFDQEDPLCLTRWKEEFTPWNDIDRCCLETRKQLECTKEVKELSWGRVNHVCKTGPGTVSYWLNNKAYRYCQQQEYW